MQIPALPSMDTYVDRSAAGIRPPKARKTPQSLEEQFLESYRPPIREVNRYVLVASAAIAAGLAVYSAGAGRGN